MRAGAGGDVDESVEESAVAGKLECLHRRGIRGVARRIAGDGGGSLLRSGARK